MAPNHKFRLDEAPERLRQHMTPTMRTATRDRAVVAWTALLELVAEMMRAYGYRAWVEEGVHRFGREVREKVVVVRIVEGRLAAEVAEPDGFALRTLLGTTLDYDPYTDAIVGRVRSGAYTREGEPVRDSPLAVLVSGILSSSQWEQTSAF